MQSPHLALQSVSIPYGRTDKPSARLNVACLMLSTTAWGLLMLLGSMGPGRYELLLWSLDSWSVPTLSFCAYLIGMLVCQTRRASAAALSAALGIIAASLLVNALQAALFFWSCILFLYGGIDTLR